MGARTTLQDLDVEAWVLAGRLDALVSAARGQRRVGTRRWLADALERALLLADPGAATDEVRAAARELGVDPSAIASEPPAPAHAVSVPLVVERARLGFVRMVYVTPDPTGRGSDGTGDVARDAIADALAAAARFGRPAASPLRLTAAQPGVLRRIRIDGRSIGAAAFVSAVALSTGRRVLPGVVVTGEVDGDRVGTVGGLAEKLEGVLEDRSDLRRLVVPARNRASVERALSRALPSAGARSLEIVGVGTLEALISATLAPAPSARPSPEREVARAREEFMRGWQGYRWPTQREPLLRLAAELPARRPDLRVEALTLLGAVTRHVGDPETSLAFLDDAAGIVDTDAGREAVPDLPLTLLHQHRALTLQQLARFGEAAREAQSAIRVAKRARLRGELLKAHGCAGLVDLSRGKPDRAVAHQEKALSLVRSHRPEAAPRTRGYLIEALGAAGDLEGARRHLRAGLRALERHYGPQERGAREAWLRVAFASAAGRAGNWRAVRRTLDADGVREAVEHAPLPGLAARRWTGLSAVHEGRREAGFELLAASPVAYGRGLAPHQRFLAHLNVLHEARVRLEVDAFGPDVAARAQTALAVLPRGPAETFLGPSRRAVVEALDVGGRRLARALDRLLARCDRLA